MSDLLYQASYAVSALGFLGIPVGLYLLATAPRAGDPDDRP